MDRAPKPILCYVTDRRSLAYPAWPAGPPAGRAGRRQAGLGGSSGVDAEPLSRLRGFISSAVAAGVDWIQIREKDLSAAALFELVRDAEEMARGLTRVLVNDRLDVALAAGAGGVHLGETSPPAGAVVRWLRRAKDSGRARGEFLVGVSCHSLEAALAAERAGADYVIFGPVFETPSKAAFGPPQGLARLEAVCSRVQVPVLAIGGMTAENAGSCFSSGAAGIAAIRLFQEAEDLAAKVLAVRSAWG